MRRTTGTRRSLSIGCGDNYVAMASRNKDKLPENVIVPYIDFDFMDSLQQKERFYSLCEKHGVDYPKTIVYKKEMGFDFACDFPYPVILKRPTASVTGSILPDPEQDL